MACCEIGVARKSPGAARRRLQALSAAARLAGDQLKSYYVKSAQKRMRYRRKKKYPACAQHVGDSIVKCGKSTAATVILCPERARPFAARRLLPAAVADRQQALTWQLSKPCLKCLQSSPGAQLQTCAFFDKLRRLLPVCIEMSLCRLYPTLLFPPSGACMAG